MPNELDTTLADLCVAKMIGLSVCPPEALQQSLRDLWLVGPDGTLSFAGRAIAIERLFVVFPELREMTATLGDLIDACQLHHRPVQAPAVLAHVRSLARLQEGLASAAMRLINRLKGAPHAG